MPHVRIRRHYIHTPFLIMAALEAVIAGFGAYLGHYTQFQEFPDFVTYAPPAGVFAVIVVVSMLAMGVYESHLREGYSGMMLRTAVSVFLLTTLGVGVVAYLLPGLEMDRGILLFATIETFILIAVWRWIVQMTIDQEKLKKRVLVLGTGQRALKIAMRMRRRLDQRSFHLAGFIDLDNGASSDLVSEHGANVITTDLPLVELCREYNAREIVVAVDERRRNQAVAGGLPLEDLMECRLSGINVCDVQQFIERESAKIDVDLLRPSWVVFSDGFITNVLRAATKRSFDVLTSFAILLFAWPVMLLTAICICLESGGRGPILYYQARVGLNGRPFNVMKFRSMATDAEAAGEARWAEPDDPRTTKVGAFLRKSRIDELPQLLNVLKGDMSFVGPRPERPVFVEELKDKIPFYEQRHRVKPGITGWAQLCYPYGASVADAKEKLQYDLYYLKNHSLLLDLVILIQTVEVVLVGGGAR